MPGVDCSGFSHNLRMSHLRLNPRKSENAIQKTICETTFCGWFSVVYLTESRRSSKNWCILALTKSQVINWQTTTYTA